MDWCHSPVQARFWIISSKSVDVLKEDDNLSFLNGIRRDFSDDRTRNIFLGLWACAQHTRNHFVERRSGDQIFYYRLVFMAGARNLWDNPGQKFIKKIELKLEHHLIV